MNVTYQNDLVCPHRTTSTHFPIKKLKWNLFVEGYQFKTTNYTGTSEVDAKKLDLNACIQGVSPKHRLKSHFIRIGILHLNSPRKIEMQKYSDG